MRGRDPHRSKRLWAALLSGALLCRLGVGFAGGLDKYGYPEEQAPLHVEEVPEWSEDKVSLPAYPDPNKLISVDLGASLSRYEYQIDPASLSVGHDGVVHYTLVLRSSSGARNVFFEGVRCNTHEYKTYAFGHAQGGFRRRQSPPWEPLRPSGPQAYREALARSYLCSSFWLPLKVDRILSRLRSPSEAGFDSSTGFP